MRVWWKLPKRIRRKYVNNGSKTSKEKRELKALSLFYGFTEAGSNGKKRSLNKNNRRMV